VVASAPGIVSNLFVDSVGGGLGGEINHHLDKIGTDCIHLSKQLVSPGQEVSRGKIIGLSGPGGDVFQHTHFDFFYYGKGGLVVVDPYRPSKEGDPNFSGFVENNRGYWFLAYKTAVKSWIPLSQNDMRNSTNHWTKDNDAQYAVT